MATTVRARRAPPNYDEKVYAALLGAAIGSGLASREFGLQSGVPRRELGRIGYELPARGGISLAGADAGLVLSLASVRSLRDIDADTASSTASSGAYAQTLLNYVLRNDSSFSWTGFGNSTLHTAYERLVSGTAAAMSGAIETNSQAVAEQFGAEACGIAWGLVRPCAPQRAADLASTFARVTHDGVALQTTRATAAMVSAAFHAENYEPLFEAAMEAANVAGTGIGSLVSRLFGSVRQSKQDGADWRAAREKLLAFCHPSDIDARHALPQFAGVVLALAYGGNDIGACFEVAASSGWGGRGQLSILGSILGAQHGLPAIDAQGGWRRALADRLYLPTADVGRCVSDALLESQSLCALGRLAMLAPLPPAKKGARLNFDLPGSVQGFAITSIEPASEYAALQNIAGHSRLGKRCLALEYRFSGAAHSTAAADTIPPFAAVRAAHEKPSSSHLHFLGSPALFPGQTISAFVEADAGNDNDIGVRLFVRYLDAHNLPQIVRGPEKLLLPEARHEFSWTVPASLQSNSSTDTLRVTKQGVISQPAIPLGCPICAVGLEVGSVRKTNGVLYLDYLTWGEAPRVDLGPSARGESGGAWQECWVNCASHVEFGARLNALCLSQDPGRGKGLLIQGTQDWRDYTVLANVTPRLAKCAGIAIRVQGLRRYYALLLEAPSKARLIRQHYGETLLAEAPFEWTFGQTVEMSLSAEGRRLIGKLNGIVVFSLDDPQVPFEGGACALVVEEGCVECSSVRVAPVD